MPTCENSSANSQVIVNDDWQTAPSFPTSDVAVNFEHTDHIQTMPTLERRFVHATHCPHIRANSTNGDRGNTATELTDDGNEDPAAPTPARENALISSDETEDQINSWQPGGNPCVDKPGATPRVDSPRTAWTDSALALTPPHSSYMIQNLTPQSVSLITQQKKS
ncbi:uncharacterized protein FTOL_08637 [Fusarium torulosum]|uniref:Uncharacterized protein n=1 Tax=Fusarium torulosum TaxID=33205 RepID=A0AAE8SKM1_9HYPO|nr:uncharacterized protein FTOL_08637 [Fusarium torulosum]